MNRSAANTIGSSDIIDGAILTQDLADSAVTSAKLAPNSVGSGNVVIIRSQAPTSRAQT
jgi:hypothetical protein